MAAVKTCTKCGEAKEPHLFPKNKNKPGGLDQWCRACQSAQQRLRRAAMSDESKQQEREKYQSYYRTNKDKILEYHRNYYAKNRDRCIAVVRARQIATGYKSKSGKGGKRAAPRDLAADAARARKCAERLTNGYVRRLLVKLACGLDHSHIPQEVVDLKREQMRLVRLTKERAK